LDNRRENLRAVTPARNTLNMRKFPGNRTSLRGVHAQGGGYIARIGKQYLGFFADANEAAFAVNRYLNRVDPGVGLRNPVDYSALLATLAAKREAVDLLIAEVMEAR
jgi:hypothetical protein